MNLTRQMVCRVENRRLGIKKGMLWPQKFDWWCRWGSLEEGEERRWVRILSPNLLVQNITTKRTVYESLPERLAENDQFCLESETWTGKLMAQQSTSRSGWYVRYLEEKCIKELVGFKNNQIFHSYWRLLYHVPTYLQASGERREGIYSYRHSISHCIKHYWYRYFARKWYWWLFRIRMPPRTNTSLD